MISVCIATYNASKFINAQIVSILGQLASNDEVIVSDDSSTDDTVEIITSINDARIKVIKGEIRLGVIKNFERALYAARGDIVFLSDQDDVWLPSKVEVCVGQLTTFTLVVSDCVVVDANLNTLSPSFFEFFNSKKGILRNIYKNSYIGCCIAFRKELLDIALPFPAKIPMHDIWLGLLAEMSGHVGFLPDKLLLYRRHDKNISGLSSENSLLKKLKLRILLIANITIRLASVLLIRVKKN